MSQYKCVICVTVFMGATACITGPEDEVDVEAVESELLLEGPPEPAIVPDGDDGVGTPGFVDACRLRGRTRATFHATGSFDAHDEGVTAALPLPFPFRFYGVSQSRYWITTNGQLGFGSTPGGSAFGQVTCPIPDSRFTAPILLAYSADLVGRLEPHAGVCYATRGKAPKRQLVVTWKDAYFYEAWLTSHVTFSATLNEGTNVIDVAIARVDVPQLLPLEAGLGAALGRQSGSSGQAFSCFQSLAPAGTVIHYGP